MTGWVESKFIENCRSTILFLHSLDSDIRNGDNSMSWHLGTFAKTFRGKFTVPSSVYVVPTSHPDSALPRETASRRLLQLKAMTEGLNGDKQHNWHASIFPGVFKGQPETAWSATLLLLKSITQAQEFFASPGADLSLIPPKFPEGCLTLNDLSDSLFREFEEKGRDRDLDAIIMLGWTALEFTPVEHPERHLTLIHLASLLSERFNKEGRKEDLDEAITLKRAASEYMSPGDPQKQTILLELDNYLFQRFKRTDSMVDLEEIISLRRAALERTPQPNRCRVLLDLADALHEQFQNKGTENSIAEAVSLARAALDLCPPRHPDHASPRDRLESYLETTRLVLKDFANPLFKEFKKEEGNRDLDEMIMLGQTALEFTPPDHPQRLPVLTGLVGLLSERSNKEGRKEDLDELITLKRAASESMPLDEPQRQRILLELDNHLLERFKRSHSTVDLEEIISLRRAALERTPQPNRCKVLLNLADALHEQFQKQGMENSLAEAFSLARAASSLCPSGHPDHAFPRDCLASYLETARLALKDLANPLFKDLKKKERNRDLDTIIMLGRTALEFTPSVHPQYHPTLTHLVGFLSERFDKEERKEDLDEIITLKFAASEYMSPDEPQRQGVLLELDGHLSERFKRTDSTVDLEEIITVRRAALERTPQPDRCGALLSLANALHEQFQRQGTENSIAEAVSLMRTALCLCPRGYPDHALARDHLAKYVQTKVGKKATRTHHSSTSSHDIERLIKQAVSAKVKEIPLYLLYTPTGKLCDRDAQISFFENSPQYKELLSLASSLDNQQLKAEINNVVSEYFGFATLSHKWGSGEPSLRDVKGKWVYEDLRSTDVGME
ncbi:hypothetical protein EDD16DRAFT_261483 [Pisolithus croceorrhizus]|nr:hypothetical protein EDD16DRAFT_261483 [Pisolithus croceorrhizus]